MLVLIFSLLFSPAPQRMGWCQAHLGFVFPPQASFKASSWLVQRFIPQRILNPIKSAITINRHKMVILFSIFLKELYTDSCRECTSLHSYQQCMRVLPRLTFPQKRNAMRAFWFCSVQENYLIHITQLRNIFVCTILSLFPFSPPTQQSEPHFFPLDRQWWVCNSAARHVASRLI